MALRLNGAAHQPERHQRITIQVHGKSRDDRVEGALSRRHLVRMAGLKREAGAAVLQRNSGIGNDDARPKPLVIGLNRSEEHTSELQSLMRISYAVFCLKKKKTIKRQHT